MLNVISSSPGELDPVFNAILQNAARICQAQFGTLNLYDGTVYRTVALHNAPQNFARKRLGETFRPHPDSGLAYVARNKQVVQIDDIRTRQPYSEGDKTVVELADIAGARTLLIVPMLNKEKLVGTISIYRREVRPFTGKQIELVQNFAAQAVIAIENARLLNELRQSLERQTATSEVLQVISSSPGDLEPVFATMLDKAVGICDAQFGTLYLREADRLRLMSTHNVPPAFAEAQRKGPFRPAPHGMLDAVMKTGRAVHLADLADAQSYLERDPRMVEAVEVGGIRTVVGVPLLKEGELIGLIGIYRQEVRPFTDKQVDLVQNFAAQAVIAIENARLLNELRQSLEQQTATAEVLQVISSSPGDLQPVFAAMLENAARICDANFGNIFRWDGEALRLIATHNTPPAFAEARRRLPLQPNRVNPIGHMLATQKTVHIADLAADARYTEQHDPDVVIAVELGGIRTFVAVPMLKENKLIGALIAYRQEVRPFTDKQIALVENFAAQAVIAIENARLLNELRQRTGDLTEALEQQMATSEVLRVISSSAGDLNPVFDVVLTNATQICEAIYGGLFLAEGEAFRTVALHNVPPAFAEARRREPLIHARPGTIFGRVAATKELVQIADVQSEPASLSDPRSMIHVAGVRTLLIVPMIKDEELVGAVGIFRQEVRPFTGKQIALVTNFAAQAVIAIDNARLLNELRQSLEQQTATSDVLQVISSSPGDLDPVFTTMLEKAVHICDAKYGTLYLPDDGKLRLVAAYDVPEFFAARRGVAFDPAPGGGLDEALRAKRPVQIPDLAATKSYIERHPGIVEAVELAGIRTGLAVPMLKDDDLIGIIAIHRREVLPFTDKQIELVKNFAAQAVIAIENARLLNELRQSLERQTAMAEVLQVISGSPGDLQPVFESVLANATRLCEATFANLLLYEGGRRFRVVALHNAPAAFAEYRWREPVFELDPQTPLLRAITARAPLQVADFTEEATYKLRDGPSIALGDLGGARTFLVVPMFKEDEIVGAIAIYRQEVRPFTDKQIELVTNFAAQATIAIENARLLNELRDRTTELERSDEVMRHQAGQLEAQARQLEQRVADQVGEIERMGRLRRFLPPQVADLIVASGTEKQLESHRREITALFCDLRGFTGFSESADPEDVMTLLREYHEALGASIIKYSGTLERYAGDGVMVVFNDPVPVENPALQAVLMALEMREAIGALTETWRRWGHEIGFGIGIAHGFATLGTIGFEGRFDYAAIGTVSNVASRLCDEAKPGQILISPRVLTKVENAVTGRAGR